MRQGTTSVHVFQRVLIGAGVAVAIAIAARRARSLSLSGALAAVVVGTIVVAPGLAWGVLLLVFFVLSTALSRYGETTKAARTGDIVAKGGERDARQVLANGGVLALAALLALIAPDAPWIALGAGALAASMSDTWATEIGTLSARVPRSIMNGRRVPAGTSGGITVMGVGGAVAGALVLAAAVLALGWPARMVLGVWVAGIAGSTIDSVLGATLQASRWCERCKRMTEREVHRCGEHTRAHGGIAWLDNDVVNLVSSTAGGLLAFLLAWYS